MKKLTLQLILPLTIISFFIFTKWWYTLPVDAPDTMFVGFPFPFLCDGWHTSMSLQIFIMEFLADLLIYFLFWFILVFCINRYVAVIKINKIFTAILLIASILISIFCIWIASFKENIFYIKRDFDIEVMESGYKFIWQPKLRPDYYKYHPEKK